MPKVTLKTASEEDSKEVTPTQMCIRDSIQADQDIEIMNPDQVIATLNGGKDRRLAMELTITKGRGYISADKGKSDDMPIGVLAVDAIDVYKRQH